VKVAAITDAGGPSDARERHLPQEFRQCEVRSAEAGLGPEASNSTQGNEAVRAARPLPAKPFEPDPVDHATQDGDGHDRVVGIAQDRDKVGHQVNGQGQVVHR
jgi:hypothetical protein